MNIEVRRQLPLCLGAVVLALGLLPLAKAMELGVTIVFAENLRRIMKTNPLEE